MVVVAGKALEKLRHTLKYAIMYPGAMQVLKRLETLFGAINTHMSAISKFNDPDRAGSRWDLFVAQCRDHLQSWQALHRRTTTGKDRKHHLPTKFLAEKELCGLLEDLVLHVRCMKHHHRNILDSIQSCVRGPQSLDPSDPLILELVASRARLESSKAEFNRLCGELKEFNANHPPTTDKDSDDDDDEGMDWEDFCDNEDPHELQRNSLLQAISDAEKAQSATIATVKEASTKVDEKLARLDTEAKRVALESATSDTLDSNTSLMVTSLSKPPGNKFTQTMEFLVKFLQNYHTALVEQEERRVAARSGGRAKAPVRSDGEWTRASAYVPAPAPAPVSKLVATPTSVPASLSAPESGNWRKAPAQAPAVDQKRRGLANAFSHGGGSGGEGSRSQPQSQPRSSTWHRTGSAPAPAPSRGLAGAFGASRPALFGSGSGSGGYVRLQLKPRAVAKSTVQ